MSAGAGEFPILQTWSRERDEFVRAGGVLPRSIPWSTIAPHERQADHNHYQTLEGLAERGGLSPSEACAVLEDRAWHPMKMAAAVARLVAAAQCLARGNSRRSTRAGRNSISAWCRSALDQRWHCRAARTID